MAGTLYVIYKRLSTNAIDLDAIWWLIPEKGGNA